MTGTTHQRGTAPFTPESLTGEWHLHRRIEDARAGSVATMTGRAVYTPDGTGLRYRETGLLTMPGGHVFQADRRYLWRFPEPGRVEVLFEDGRFFHDFDPDRPGRERVHLCDPDMYRGRYQPLGSGWRMIWRVTGPRKEQRLVTDYTRAV